jgi:hypothetical protein
MPMSGKENGVVGSIGIGKVGKWIEAYEKAREEERKLREQLRRIERLLKESENAAYVIDVTKLQQQKKENEDKLKTVQQRRLNLEWLAVSKIKKGEWDPQLLIEYSFVRDLLLLNRIREEQTKEICRDCNECRLIRVKTTEGKEVPLEVAKPDKACSLPYVPYYTLKEIWERKQELQMKVRPLGPLTPEERAEAERWVSQRLALYHNLIHGFIEERRRVLSRKLLKTGCTRRLPKVLAIREKEIGEDWDPKYPDHFVGDIIAEVGEDGGYTKVYISSKHGSEESE